MQQVDDTDPIARLQHANATDPESASIVVWEFAVGFGITQPAKECSIPLVIDVHVANPNTEDALHFRNAEPPHALLHAGHWRVQQINGVSASWHLQREGHR